MNVGDIFVCIKEITKGQYTNGYNVDDRVIIHSNLGSLYRIKKIEEGIQRISIVAEYTLLHNFKPFTNERRKSIIDNLYES